MRNLSLILTIFGISFIFLYMLFYSPHQISSQKQIDSMLANEKVFFSGKVMKQSYQTSYVVFNLDKNITLYCYYCAKVPKLEGKTISGTGIIDTYQKSKIKVLKIEWKN